MTITLPDELREEAESKARMNGFRSVEDYLCYLIVADDPENDGGGTPVSLRHWPPAELERLIQEGLDSGPAILADDNFWQELDRRAVARAAARRGEADPCHVIQAETVDDEEEFPLPPNPARTPRNREELERMLDEGTASGEWIRADDAFWAEMRRKLHERHAQDPNRKP